MFDLGAARSVLEGPTVTGGFTDLMSLGEAPGDGGGFLAFEGEEAVLRVLNVSGNVAGQNGAGVSAPPESGNRTAVTIENSTIANNKVTGAALEALGGGVYVLGKLSIVNSTIAGNSVGATGLGGGLAVFNPTPAMGGSATLLPRNTILAGNTGPAGPSNCALVALPTSDHSLSSDESCMLSDAGSKQNANPLLGALANNGGETNTMALLEGSPAIDAGINAGCPPVDQRGVTRPQGPACDVGAFERAAVPPPPAADAADLRLRIKPKPKRPVVGGKLAFLVTVRNGGPSAATGTVVKGTAPALTKRIAGPKVNGKRACKLAKVKGGKRKFTCQLGEIAAGKQKRLRVVVKTKQEGKVRVRARVRSGVADPNLKNNKAKRGVKVREA